jgi:hypothetical protein
LRLVVTDQRIACILRPGALPSDVRARLDDNVRTREALQAHGIGAPLSLIPNEILGQFHDDPRTRRARRPRPGRRRHPCADEPGQATTRPHPDLMFALRLTETPDPAAG